MKINSYLAQIYLSTPSQAVWQIAHMRSKSCHHFTASSGFTPHSLIRLTSAAAKIKGSSWGHAHCWGHTRDCFSLCGQALPVVVGKWHWNFFISPQSMIPFHNKENPKLTKKVFPFRQLFSLVGWKHVCLICLVISCLLSFDLILQLFLSYIFSHVSMSFRWVVAFDKGHQETPACYLTGLGERKTPCESCMSLKTSVCRGDT